MAGVWSGIRQVGRLLQHSSLVPSIVSKIMLPQSTILPSTLSQVTFRSCSSYDPYPKFDEPGDPYHAPLSGRRYGYHYKFYKHGPLPRPEGDYEDKPLRKMPRYKAVLYGQWTKKKAEFGQNDYIDILGDGSVHPWQLMGGPVWLRGFKGPELHRLIHRLHYEGSMLRDLYPTKYHEIRKQIFYLWKKQNTRRHTPFWGGRGSGKRSRLLNIKDRPR